MPPNATRVLEQWGILPELEKLSIAPGKGMMRSYRDGEILSTVVMGDDLCQKYGAPYLLVHRVDLHHLLADAAQREGAIIQLGAEVTGITSSANNMAFVQLANNTSLSADLVLAADGERSRCRSHLLGQESPWRDSGDHVFRATIPIQALHQNDQLSQLTEGLNWWIGPQGNALTYSLKRDNLFNIVLTQAHAPDAEIQFAPKPIAQPEVAAEFPNWDPLFHRLLTLANSCTRWTLLHTDMAPRWTAEAGNIALVGDAAHAMLPYT